MQCMLSAKISLIHEAQYVAVRKCDPTFLPIGIRHGNEGDDPEAATATAARRRCDSDAISSTANATAVHASDVTSTTDDVIPTPFPDTSAFR